MSVGIVLVAHDGIGPALAGTAHFVLGDLPLPVRVVVVSRDSQPEEVFERLDAVVSELDQGDGVLILTDMFGATPTNVARRIAAARRVRIVTGANLPMLLNVLNFPGLGLDELAAAALTGGRDGVLPVEKN
ncbi:MAG: PTS fructose transporter subunit IIA [Gammaproteobacteria bacterium]|nr:PTS fructose transporter subunit IIA [Gammaproteobacteria bacterium]